MRRHLLAHTVPALWVAALLLPAGAIAQTAPQGPPGIGAATSSDAAEQAMLQRVDRRIADLHAKLHITAAEESQWRQFADVMRDNVRQMARKLAEREQKFRSMNAVGNMQSYAGIAEQHAKNMEHLVPAFQNLYNALSDQQKRMADQLWRNYAEQASRQHRR